ncbi:F-box protein At3g07870-like [Prunus avium]|uniref:F-box protein At3g07870-like n=1 Tax=Prunus avium TaxID=42229 RepID=A0A6P5RBF1_PRUAV|nr:F-box protein At3g07870-like [Prunus avium]
MSGVYKIVWLRGCYGLEPEAFVLTVGSGTWRSTGKCRYRFMYKHGICLSGFLHWINYSRTMICTFDLESEDFQELPLPPGWDLESLKKSGLDFRVLRGCLSVTVRSMERMSIWVMKEYGVKESWSLEFSIVDIVYTSYVLKFGDGQLLLLHGGKLLAYACGSKGFVDVEFDAIRHLRDECVHIPSFASPKIILSGVRPGAPDREY